MPSCSIRDVLSHINNRETEEGYWLPNIQRDFVWKETQVTELFDSVLRGYPIGSFLFWKTKSDVQTRKFIDDYKSDSKSKDQISQTSQRTKVYVLDGQQRLQSFFIGLMGSYNSKELYINILSGSNVVPPDDAKYILKFMDDDKASFPFIKLKSIIYTDLKPSQVKSEIESSADKVSYQLSNEDKDIIFDNLDRIRFCMGSNEVIQFNMLISTDEGGPNIKYTEDDIVEIFIRANSGGTRLEKTDLLFSLLSSKWDKACQKIDELIEELNSSGYKYTRDFILKTCICLLTRNAKLSVEKFRTEGLLDRFIAEWNNIEKAIQKVNDYIKSETYIKSDQTLIAYYVLIPIIYYAYSYPNSWKKSEKMDEYLIQCLLSGSFSGSSDTQITRILEHIENSKSFIADDIYNIIRENRTLGISKEKLLHIKYGDKELPLIFYMWYKNYLNFHPIYSGNMLQVDHIFPESALKKVKDGRKQVYKQQDRDKIGNLSLLTADENGAGNKGDKLPEEWFANKSAEYLERHLIPNNPELWKLENYPLFIEEREKLIIKKFEKYLKPDMN